MHLRFLPGQSRRPAQGSTHFGGEVIGLSRTTFWSAHDFCRSLGRSPELSYTAQASASWRYTAQKFFQLRPKRRTTSVLGTLCPPCLTRSAMTMDLGTGARPTFRKLPTIAAFPRPGAALGKSARFWMNLQLHYDPALAALAHLKNQQARGPWSAFWIWAIYAGRLHRVLA